MHRRAARSSALTHPLGHPTHGRMSHATSARAAGPQRRAGRRAMADAASAARDMPSEPITPRERDLDLVEASFVEGFTRCSDATSFLRLAGIPFVGVAAYGRQLHLLRVEIKDITDVGSAVPLLGGEGMRYDPLPEKLVSRRRHLSFVYHDGGQVVHLGFAEVRALAAL